MRFKEFLFCLVNKRFGEKEKMEKMFPRMVRDAVHSVGRCLVQKSKAILGTRCPGDLARVQDQSIGCTYPPDLFCSPNLVCKKLFSHGNLERGSRNFISTDSAERTFRKIYISTWCHDFSLIYCIEKPFNTPTHTVFAKIFILHFYPLKILITSFDKKKKGKYKENPHNQNFKIQ